MIVKGKGKIYMELKCIEFGAYALVYVGKTNTMKIRSVPEIELKESNETWGLYFTYFYTGKTIHIYNWDELTIDHRVIRRVDELSENEDQPTTDIRHFIFEWSSGHEIIGEEILISDNNQILEYKDAEYILNKNNEEIEGEYIEIDNTEY